MPSYPLGLFTNTQTKSFPLSLFWVLSLLTWTFSHSHSHSHKHTQQAAFSEQYYHSLLPSPPLLSLTLITYYSSLNSVANVRIPTSAMGVVRHHRRKHHHPYQLLPTLFTTFTFLLFSSASAITTLATQPSGEAVKQLHHKEEKENGWTAAPSDRGVAVVDEKRFGLPGSSPPSCRSKCGWCNPCQPVHVPVQPGLIIRLEYYPEAWRCKCGNKLFMP